VYAYKWYLSSPSIRHSSYSNLPTQNYQSPIYYAPPVVVAHPLKPKLCINHWTKLGSICKIPGDLSPCLSRALHSWRPRIRPPACAMRLSRRVITRCRHPRCSRSEKQFASRIILYRLRRPIACRIALHHREMFIGYFATQWRESGLMRSAGI